MRVPVNLSLSDDIVKGIKNRSTSGDRVSATPSGAVKTNQARVDPKHVKSFGAQLTAAQMPQEKSENKSRENDATVSAANAAHPDNSDNGGDSIISDNSAQIAAPSSSDAVPALKTPISSGGHDDTDSISASVNLSTVTPFAETLAMTNLFFGASLQTQSSLISATASGSTSTVASGASLSNTITLQPVLAVVSGSVAAQAQSTTVSGFFSTSLPSPPLSARSGSAASASAQLLSTQQPASAQVSAISKPPITGLMAPHGATITDVSLTRGAQVSTDPVYQTDWSSLHEAGVQVAPVSTFYDTANVPMATPVPPTPMSTAMQSALIQNVPGNTGASPSREADQPANSAPLTPTSQATSPANGAVVLNSTGDAAAEDGSSSPDEKQPETTSQEKTTVTELASAIHGLSEFQSLVAAKPSSIGVEAHHVLAQGNTANLQAPSQMADLSAVGTPSTDIPSTLSMTVQTEDNTPVHLIFEGEGGLATRVILQSDDDLTTQHLAGNRKELLAALNSAGVDTSAMRLDIVTPATNTGDSHQGSPQQDNTGRADLSGGFMGSNPQQNQQGNSANSRLSPQAPASQINEPSPAISHPPKEAQSPAGRINITA
ncbi:hypothetical protein HW511_01625 [Asaia siamensis]|uniref:Flagellar hook-length control protein FliK n=1 Tax=Asaia siamensis TaxID=110479 RepID=A0ABQ1L8I5_9PROT|nr:hypothetical protein [Asaia siamensis]GBR09801.1 hypothetical protein AA0323_2600 [Asaia siamensis NRIC 0323]GGC18961.1 hypothetical protein GCM10007207_00260 [Asaia siamensis]